MTKKQNPDDVANRRFRIIAPLLQINPQDPEGKKLLAEKIRQVAKLNDVSVRSVKRWLERYQTKGFSNLTNRAKTVRSENRLIPQFDELMKRVKSARLTDHDISVSCIIRGLESAYPEIKGILKRSTVQRYVQKMHLAKRDLKECGKLKGRHVYGRYRPGKLRVVQGDTKDSKKGCVVDDVYGRPIFAYLHTFTDSFSGRILDFEIKKTEDATLPLTSLRRLVLNYGRVDCILLDNGSSYISNDFKKACKKLDIKISYCEPNSPETKGKQERTFGTARQIYTQFEARKNIPYSTFCSLVEEWIISYNNTPIAERGNKTPNQLFAEDTSRQIVPLPIDVIDVAFRKIESRKIQKDGTISVNGMYFQIPPEYATMHKRVTVYICIYDYHKVSMVLDSGEQIPLNEQVIGENVNWDMVCKPKPREDLPEEPDTIFLEALAREREKRLGTYTDEESFLKRYHDLFKLKSQPDEQDISELDKPTATQNSPYSLNDE